MNETEKLEQITRSIRKFLFDNYLFGYSENEFDIEASFLDYGVLDSLGILELITFIEKEFDIGVSDEEILPDNLDSIGRVSRFVLRKMTV
jgi:acyl carrier protein